MADIKFIFTALVLSSLLIACNGNGNGDSSYEDTVSMAPTDDPIIVGDASQYVDSIVKATPAPESIDTQSHEPSSVKAPAKSIATVRDTTHKKTPIMTNPVKSNIAGGNADTKTKTTIQTTSDTSGKTNTEVKTKTTH